MSSCCSSPVSPAYASIEFLGSSWGEYTPIFQMPAALIALPLPIGMVLLMLYAAINLKRDHGMMALWTSALRSPRPSPSPR